MEMDSRFGLASVAMLVPHQTTVVKKDVYVLNLTCGHEFWAVTKRWRIQVAGMRFL